ncbi:hypothetical protein QYF36_014460 [Acer negundo]|nr:hypothetical protein QYF36_014460 [Acer negundo]
MESSNVVIDDCRLKTSNYEEEVVVVDGSPLEKVLAMKEELNQLEMNEVWTLVLRPKSTNVIGTKWAYRNKSDEDGNIVHNKARIVT